MDMSERVSRGTRCLRCCVAYQRLVLDRVKP